MKRINRRNFIKLAGVSAPLALSIRPERVIDPHSPGLKPEDLSGPWLEINLDNIAWNLIQLRRMVRGKPIMAVVKANAYGHGLLEVSRFLQDQSIEGLAVANAHQAIRLRDNGITRPVLNLGPFSEAEATELVRLGISQSIYTDDYIRLAEAARKAGKRANVHIKIDTGLGRLGVPYYRALPLIRKIAETPEINIEGVFTALTEEKDFDSEQVTRLLEVVNDTKKEGIDPGIRHAASSAAILDFPRAHLDIVRPGIAIYGNYPSERAREEKVAELRPAMQLKAPVLYVKTLRPGDGVSYHRPFIAKDETTVATIGIGYSDGYPRTVVNKGEVLIRGKRYPLIAAITANHMTALLPNENEVNVGDEVILIGKQVEEEISAEEVAQKAGISVYTLLIQMSPLLPRRFIRS